MVLNQNAPALVLACCSLVALPMLLLSIYGIRGAVQRWADGRPHRRYLRNIKNLDRDKLKLDRWLAKQEAARAAARSRGRSLGAKSIGARGNRLE